MSTLHERISAELDRREAIAQAAIAQLLKAQVAASWEAGPGAHGWAVHDGRWDYIVAERLSEAEALHVALCGPEDALRRYAADRERLEEHGPCIEDDDDLCLAHSSRYECCVCHSPGPCAEQYRIAESLGITQGAP